jgi:hypothetical protein
MRILAVISISLLFINGCATVERSGIITIAKEKKDDSKIEIKTSLPGFRVGEKLTYSIRWLGLPVATAVFCIEEKTRLNGREVYHIIYTAKSNKFASTFYKVEDEIHTYIDVENLYPLRFEKHLREGGYRMDEIVEYDQVNHRASYKSERRIKKKRTITDVKISIPPASQDPLSCLYYFRRLNADKIKTGHSIPILVNTEEKNWELEVKILETKHIEVLNMGDYNAVLVEPTAKFQGIFVRKGRIWIWLSTDERRLPLILKTKVPVVGTIYAHLEKIE